MNSNTFGAELICSCCSFRLNKLLHWNGALAFVWKTDHEIVQFIVHDRHWGGTTEPFQRVYMYIRAIASIRPRDFLFGFSFLHCYLVSLCVHFLLLLLSNISSFNKFSSTSFYTCCTYLCKWIIWIMYEMKPFIDNLTSSNNSKHCDLYQKPISPSLCVCVCVCLRLGCPLSISKALSFNFD